MVIEERDRMMTAGVNELKGEGWWQRNLQSTVVSYVNRTQQ